MSGLQKPVINAIRSVAFLLDELEDTQINETVKEAFDSQTNEFTIDMKTLIDDVKEKIDAHLKSTEDRLAQAIATVQAQAPPHSNANRTAQPTNSYASVLINPPAYANPRVAAKEGIRARQFAIDGFKNTEFSHLDPAQLKAVLNRFLTGLGLTTGKLRSVTSSRGGNTIIEADNDEAARWLSRPENQRKLRDKIGPNIQFIGRTYNVLAFNVPIVINPGDENHRAEICESNDMEANTISAAKWAKAEDKRSPNQRTAHLYLTFDSADAANRAITNGLTICNRRCHVEKTKREPTRCLKCQGWNHFAKDCVEGNDKCGNCAGAHRTSVCLSKDRSCVSCRTNDHASWSRSCPVFVKKMDEFNSRNPDNLLQFFPTADPWTWSSAIKTQPTPASAPTNSKQMPATSQNKMSSVQQGKRPQQDRRRFDTYIPTDTYIPNYSNTNTSTLADQPTDTWDDAPLAGPSNSQRNSSSSSSTRPGPPPTSQPTTVHAASANAVSNNPTNSNPSPNSNPNSDRPSNPPPTNHA